jgi:hypothetical protein
VNCDSDGDNGASADVEAWSGAGGGGGAISDEKKFLASIEYRCGCQLRRSGCAYQHHHNHQVADKSDNLDGHKLHHGDWCSS